MIKRTLNLFLILIVMTGFAHQQQELFAQSVPYATLSAFIWTDKYVYSPGEAITLRWTARANADPNMYTVVVYRQNNQSGVKTYMSIGGATSATAVDILGRTPEQGFIPLAPGDVTKGVVTGSGGWLSAQVVAPPDLGMHTFVVEFRDATGTRILKSAYAKIGVVSGFETLSGNILLNKTLVNTIAYRLSGVVLVSGGATLT